MRLPNSSALLFAIAAVVVIVGVMGTGTWALAQSASSGIPAAENQGAQASRIGQTQRGHAPLPLPEQKMETGQVPAAENQGAPASRIGQTQRGQAPMPLPEQKMETGAVPPPEVQGATSSRIGQTQRGQAPMPMSK